jgi:hypothetical protein
MALRRLILFALLCCRCCGRLSPGLSAQGALPYCSLATDCTLTP